jgi:hypothetical protein
MKKSILFAALLGCVSILAQDPAGVSGPVIVERGPHHRVWETYTTAVNDKNEVLIATNSFTELQTGIHYWDGQWVESSEVIEPFPQGAVARKGQFQMVFSPQLNVPGAIDL